MKLEPTHERILIVPDPEKKQTTGGILIPDDVKEPSMFGTIVAWGEKASESISNLRRGDRVMFLKYAGMDVEIDGVMHKLIMANDVIGKVTDEK